MRRLVWVAVGAAGGIWAYRTAVRLRDDARERGLVVTAQEAGLSAAATVAHARELAARLTTPRAADVSTSGHAAARVLATREGR